MEFDHELLEGARDIERKVRNALRAVDIMVVPTSLVRTVMRREDRQLESEKWEKETFMGRYHSKNPGRWVFPVAYSVAGTLEGVRVFGYGWGLYEAAKGLFG